MKKPHSIAAIAAFLIGVVFAITWAVPQIKYNGLSYTSSGVTFSCLGGGCGDLSPPQLNGTMVYCNDCQQTTTCLSGGSGAWAKRIAGIWKCTDTNVTGVVTDPLPLNTLTGIGVLPTIQLFQSINSTRYITGPCDGSTDLHAQMDLLVQPAAGGGELVFPPSTLGCEYGATDGSYTGTFTVPANVHLVGAGIGASIIHFNGTGGGVASLASNGGVLFNGSNSGARSVRFVAGANSTVDAVVNVSAVTSAGGSIGQVTFDDVSIRSLQATATATNPIALVRGGNVNFAWNRGETLGKFRQQVKSFATFDTVTEVHHVNFTRNSFLASAGVYNDALPQVDMLSAKYFQSFVCDQCVFETGPYALGLGAATSRSSVTLRDSWIGDGPAVKMWRPSSGIFRAEVPRGFVIPTTIATTATGTAATNTLTVVSAANLEKNQHIEVPIGGVQRSSAADTTTTSGTPLISSTSINWTSDDVGSTITGTGIPGGTKVLEVLSDSDANLTNNATATNTNTVITLTDSTFVTRIAGISGVTVTTADTLVNDVPAGTNVYTPNFAGHVFRATVDGGVTGATQPAAFAAPPALPTTIADNTQAWVDYGPLFWVVDHSAASLHIDGGTFMTGTGILYEDSAVGAPKKVSGVSALTPFGVWSQDSGASIAVEDTSLLGCANFNFVVFNQSSRTTIRNRVLDNRATGGSCDILRSLASGGFNASGFTDRDRSQMSGNGLAGWLPFGSSGQVSKLSAGLLTTYAAIKPTAGAVSCAIVDGSTNSAGTATVTGATTCQVNFAAQKFDKAPNCWVQDNKPTPQALGMTLPTVDSFMVSGLTDGDTFSYGCTGHESVP